MCEIDWPELRSWATLFIAIIGIVVAYHELKSNTNQRRTDNSFKYIDMFHENISELQIQKWEMVFQGSYDRGSKTGFSNGHRIIEYSELFSEGPFDHGAVDKMCEIFDLIAEAIENRQVEFRLVYFELGQYMEHNYKWLMTFEENENKHINNKFRQFIKLMNKSKEKRGIWSHKTISYYG